MRTRDGYRIAAVWGLVLLSLGTFCQLAHAADNAPQTPDGRELFTRKWQLDDPRSVAGDGLGPMFNEVSCVACHNQGGIGGGGAGDKNITMLSVVAIVPRSIDSTTSGPSNKDPYDLKTRLINVHPEFASSRSILLHASSTDELYARWRARFRPTAPLGTLPRPSRLIRSSDQDGRQRLGLVLLEIDRSRSSGTVEVDGFAFIVSSRNSPPLFGAGLIDSIPEEAIRAGQSERPIDGVSGRVARLRDGRIGRFGWKAQQASLKDFTFAACAVELGLNVPGNWQLGTPHKKQPVTDGLDMNQEQCDALVKFVSQLDRPVQEQSLQESDQIELGAARFKSVGCAACHVPNLGSVSGLYSDLLLHDMGPTLADSGGYYRSAMPNTTDESETPLPLVTDFRSRQPEPTTEDLAKTVGALRQEWRTPPLWGCRDSAPYLHDGSANTLEQAIALHAGEAEQSKTKCFALPINEFQQLLAFLKSLAAPGVQ